MVVLGTIAILGIVVVVEFVYILELKQQSRELYDEYCEHIKNLNDGKTSNDF